MTDESGRGELWAVAEALCFTLNRPVRYTEIAKVSNCPVAEVAAAVAELADRLSGHGIMVQHDERSVQIVTHPSVAFAMQLALSPERPSRLTKSSLETLAIVAYRQPITKAEIDHLRGVDCERVLETLERRGLVGILGHDDGPGQPRLWGTTLEFLRLIGIGSIGELPELEETTISTYEAVFNTDALAPAQGEPETSGETHGTD